MDESKLMDKGRNWNKHGHTVSGTKDHNEVVVPCDNYPARSIIIVGSVEGGGRATRTSDRDEYDRAGDCASRRDALTRALRGSGIIVKT